MFFNMTAGENNQLVRDRVLLQTLGAALSDALIIVGAGGNVLYFNHIAVALFGLSEESVSVGVMDGLLTDSSGNTLNLSEVSALTQNESWHQCSAHSLSGRMFLAEVRVMHCEEGGSGAMIVLVRDRTDSLIEEEAKILKAEVLEALNAVFSDARDGMMVVDEFGFIRMLSPGAERVVGDCLGRMVDADWLREVGWEYRGVAGQLEWSQFPIARALRGDIARAEVVASNTEKSTKHFIDVICRPVISKKGNCHGAVIVLHDITELRQKEQLLFHAQKVDSLGRLAAGVAHDFNNLLAVIVGFAEMSLNRLDPQSPMKRGLEQIRSAGEKAAHLTRQLLAFSRNQYLELEIAELNSLLSETGKMLRRLIPRNIEIVLLPAIESAHALLDVVQLESAIINLVLNAKDAMPNGGKLTLRIGHARPGSSDPSPVAELQVPNQVFLEVSDTGTGMPPEVMQHLFEPFFTTKPQGQGTGLGLATVYGIVKQSGGHIDVSSVVGQGTVFRIFFPESILNQNSLSGESQKVSQGKGRILLVEDDPLVLTLVQEQLKMCGYSVLPASSASEALRLMDTEFNNIDLVLTDVVMPHMSGDELVRLIHILKPELKVLFMSGYTDGKIGHSDYLQKPFSLVELSKKLREVLESKNSH